VGADDGRRFGPPPVDPASLPEVELLRVATGLLALDLATESAQSRPSGRSRTTEPARSRRIRRVRTRYELAGDPWLAGGHTRALMADGRPPGGAGRSVHVLGADVATMLAHAWATSAFGAGAPTWPDFLRRVRARRQLPRRIALHEVVERFRHRRHTGRVGVVLDPGALPRLLGVRRLDPVPDVAAHATELARQVGIALSLHVLPAEQGELLTERFLPRLTVVGSTLPAVPPEHRDWVEDAGFALRQRLLRARYPVEGDPDILLPGWSGSSGSSGYPGTRVSRMVWGVATPESLMKTPSGSVLDLAVELLLEVE
jgi:hypothetical protein